jgi:hypothetical protein
LLAAEGVANAAIGRQVGVSTPTVLAWRNRYEAGGIAALADLERSGRPPTVDENAVVVATLNAPPSGLGVTHWSSRLMSDHLRGLGMPVSFAEVARIWRDWALQPHRVETFKFSTDPPWTRRSATSSASTWTRRPTRSWSASMRSQIQPWTARRRCSDPLRPGRTAHPTRRHGTTTLFAALGRQAASPPTPAYRAPQREFCLPQAGGQGPPRVQLHVVCDNYATHSHPAVKTWLAKHPRITMHFTPTSASWMNMVEIFFGIITRQAIRRGTFTSVPDLIGAIRTFIDAYNERCQPFTWTKTADQILAKAHRQKISDTGH